MTGCITSYTNFTKRLSRFGIIFALALIIFAILMPVASAAGAPAKLIVFTDKKIYMGGEFDISSDNAAWTTEYYPSIPVEVFAIILDEDGKIISSGISFSATLKDVEILHHGTDETTHHSSTTSTDGTYWSASSSTFVDSDSDGVFETSFNLQNIATAASGLDAQDHTQINVTVTESSSGLSTTIQVMISRIGCGHSSKSTTWSSAVHGANTAHSDVACVLCHWGYEYSFGVHGDNSGLGNSTQAASSGKMPYESKSDWNYNTGYESGGGLGATGDAWINAGRSDICVACHSGYTKNVNVLDMNPATTSTADANGDSINNNDRPSCGWEQGTNAEGTWTVRPGCHVGGTDLEKTPLKNSTAYLIDWQWKANGAGGSRSHSHDSNNAGIPCEVCHGGHQIQKLPNPLATTLTEQCEYCHDRSDGWLNTTQNVAHPLTSECKNCHLDNNKLNSHTIPFGVFGGKWCMDCHNINGKSPIQLDEEVVSSSNKEYIHYELNSGSDATNSSRICWGCHTNDTVANDGAVNQDELPQSLHPNSYDTPRECTDCHYNTGSTNFSAPQNYRHTWYAPFMVTPDVNYCTDCHKQKEMLMDYNQSATIPKTDNESSAHYGKNRTSFFAPLVGTRAYCAYCHQNETTVMGPFAKNDNKVRSDHASQPTTPGCGDEICHKPGRMHDDKLVVPAFAETNIASTCQNPTCHSSVEYNSHNGTLTCWDCHMGNVSDSDPTWIHPIQFIQYNGNFTGAKLTGATCYDCHKSTNVDAATQNLSGKTAPKVDNQAHSNAPNNGTIWGQYWDYTPTTYEFADYNIVGGNGTIDLAYPFENIRVPSNDHLELVETQNGRVFEATFPIGIDDREFIETKGNWTGVVVSGVSITGGYDLSEGNPAGSLYVDRISDNTIDEYNWTSGQFYYNGSAAAGYYYANFSMDKKVTAIDNQVFADVVLIRPASSDVVIYSGIYSATDASFVSVENTDIAPYLTDDGYYSIRIYTKIDYAGGAGPGKIYYDNVKVMMKEQVWNRYELVVNTSNVPVDGTSKLGMSYQIHQENTSLYIFNKTSQAYQFLDTLDDGVFYDYVVDIDSTHHIDNTIGDGTTGNVSVMFVDDDQSASDGISDKLHIRYLYIYTDSGLQYPCEQCHSPNKHYINPTLGSPAKFSAGNSVNQPISPSSTWCQQCHWDGADNYSEMIQEFTIDRNPPENVPPEITSNTTYAPTGVSGYYDHTSLDMDDASCFACHGAVGDTTTTEFVHNVQVGSAGGVNCTECHDTGTSNPKVDVSGMNTSMNLHLNLNKDGTTPYRTEDRICWGCHVTNSSITSDGRVDYSELTDGHPTNFSKPAVCTDCHLDGGDFSAPIVDEHVPLNYATGDIPTNASDYCVLCHNNSLASFTDPNGNNPMNASASHYATNASLPTGCTWCHYDNSNNASWQSPIDPRITQSSSHTGKTDGECGSCHGGSGILHNESWGPGAGSCDACHGQPANGTIQPNMTGAHDLHATAGYGDVSETGCDYCHNDGGYNETHPNSINNVSTNASVSIATYTEVATSGNDDTCVGASCHSNGLTAGAIEGTTVWDTATAGACDTCHSTDASGLPVTGDHSAHYTAENYLCEVCHGADSDNGTNAGHKTNASIDMDFTGSLASGGTINTGTCDVYCHSPNPNDVRPNPEWGVSAVGCIDCHSNPPATTRDGTAHTASAACDDCHGIDSATGNHSSHIDGIADADAMTCDSCHGQPANGTIQPNMTGAHDLHATAGYGDVSETGCDYCHNDGGYNETHPNSINNVSTNASVSIATYTEVATSGNDDTCVGASCHSNGLTAGAIEGTTVWDTATAGACDTCHSTDASGLPVTGDHSAHYTAENYLCEVCHGADSDNGTNAGHKTNASIDMDFTGSLASGGTINTGTCDVYCHSPNPNDFKTNPEWGVSTVGCIDCHSNPPATTRDGTAHTASAACDDCHGIDSATGNHSGHIDGLIDVAMTCDSCHGQPANGTIQPNMTGAHDLHATAGYGDVSETGCDYCHNDGGYNETHPNSINNVSTNASASIATYTENATSGNDDTCVGASCHSNGLTAGAIEGITVWDTATVGACDTCHSTDASGLPITGDHSAHYTAENYLCEVCHGADSDNGTNAGHKTNASIDMDFTGSLASGGTINTGTCDVYCHSPNPNDFRTNPEWGVSIVGCIDCHSNPPATTRDGTAHTASAACDDCHGIDSATGNHSGHIDGIADADAMTCDSCHGQPANGTIQPNMTGAHDLHATAGYGDVSETGCDYCHNDGGYNETHPNSINNVSTNASASIATYTEVATSGNDDTCVGASCHSNGLTAGAIEGTTVWDTATVGACDTCHSTDASGLPVTGDHSAHYTTENYLCEVCHGADSDNGTNAGHKTNASIDMDFTGSLASGGTINTGTCDVYCHSPNPNDFKTNPEWGVSAVGCIDCHSNPPATTRDGTAHTASAACDDCHGIDSAIGNHSSHIDGIADADAMTCDSCHGQPANGTIQPNMTGAHDLHATAGYGDVSETGCDYCHNDGGYNETHPNSINNVSTNASASIATYTEVATSGNDDTCVGASCHSNGLTAGAIEGTTVWDTATAGACDTCHSTDTSGLPVTGDHSAHYTAENYLCEVCHGVDSDNGTNAGHKTNASIDMDFTGILASGGTINTGTCDVYCHSPNPNDFKTNPEWGVSTVVCGDCHSIPPTTTRGGNTHTADMACDTCHGIGAANATQPVHINGIVDAGAMSCDACHAQPPTGQFSPNMTGAHDLHKTAGYGTVPETDCDYCHFTGGLNEAHPNSINNVSTNASASIQTYTENATSGNDDTCIGASCHSNGLTAGAIEGTTVWDTATVGACDTCHSTDASGLPVTGDHSAHYTAENYLCEVCHGADSDNGTNAGHKTNASIDMDFTGSLASGGTINTGTCDVYCHSPNPNDVRTNPEWGVSAVGCIDCHSNPPATTRDGTAHTASAACDDCHGIDSATGNHSSHIDGIADADAMTCNSCHGQPANGTIQPNMTGAHDLHATAGYGDVSETGCDYCHNDGGYNETHPNSINNVSTNASASIATYTENATSGNDDTCVGASCHSNGLTAGAIEGTTVWDTATVGACDTCHSNEISGLPVTGDHSAHYTAENYLCEVCHGADSDNGTNTGHKTNASIDMDFTGSLASGGTINTGACDVYCHSPNPNDVRPNPEWGVSAVGCIDCHSNPPATTRDGTAHTNHTDCDACHGAGSITGTQTGHIDGFIDINVAICDTCHGQLPDGTVQPNMVGAHNTHNSSTFQILYGVLDEDASCNYCHNNRGNNESAHPQNDSSADVETNATVTITTYVQNTTSGNDDTCSGVSCHTDGLIKSAVADFAIWNNSIGACDICHSAETSGLPDTDNHSLHYTTKGYSCDTCHGNNADNGSQSGHMFNSVIDMNFTGVSEGTFNAGTCDEYCHSPNPNDPKPNPIWGVSTIGCEDCHSYQPTTTRNEISHSNDSNCDNCHGIDAINGTHIGHVDGIITDVLSCLACHTTVTAADLGLHASFTGTSGVEEEDCGTCHFALPHPEPNSNNTYYCEDCHTATGTATPKSSILFTEKMHGEATCSDCHISDGTHHQGDPRGAVTNATYVNRYVPGNTTVTDCADCHYARNLDDAPFNAPGGGSHAATACANGGCHAGGTTMVETMHSVGPYSYGYIPAITVPSLNVSIVNQGDIVTVNATVSILDVTKGYVDGAQYRIMDGAIEALPWTVMTASDGDFWGPSDAATASISTTALSSGTYTVEVRGMAGGPPQNASAKYYPMNGDVSVTQSTSLIVEPPNNYINGTVTSGGSPVAGTIVSTTGASTTTAADGTYSLNVVAGTYNVTANKAPVYADSMSTGVIVISDATTTQDFVLALKPTGSIAGTVTSGTA